MYQQERPFSAKLMGNKKGYALENCRLGFGISFGRYPSALRDMEDQKKVKALHRLDSLPLGVSVPIYAKPKRGIISKYGFVFVIDKNGKIYADGKRQKETYLYDMQQYFNLYWGEYCDGVRVVKKG